MENTEAKFSLKDHLFNDKKVKKIAGEIKLVRGDFNEKRFIKSVLSKFPDLELLERVYWIRDCLKKELPESYREAVKILLESLPPPCDPALEDNDFGDFIYAPYTVFVSEYGTIKSDLKFSLKALKELTTRFSVEAPIRVFINKYPEETLVELSLWAEDKHYHVRRAASEGTRPLLPWAKKVDIAYTEPVKILDKLYFDNTRFVTRSVANHLNDISKADADLVLKTLERWQKSGKQNSKEMDFITRHSLRTLVKEGHKGSLALLGFRSDGLQVNNFKLDSKRVKIGGAIEFSFNLKSTSTKEQKVMIDYLIYFKKANGQLSSKAYKISQKTLKPGEVINVTKKHPLRLMTTKKLYPGEHKIELQINGQRFGSKHFNLVT